MGRAQMFVVVTPGLESLALEELRALGVGGRVAVVRGGVEVTATTRQLYAVHRWARLPTRVLVRVAHGVTRRFDEIEELARSVDWDAFVPDGAPVELHVASRGSRLYHEGAIAERIERVLPRDVAEGGSRVYVRIDRDRATVSVDASGEALHRRGWRQRAHAAPLRPTIAAAMLRVVGYDGSVALIDPMAGSGTIPIEGVTGALGLPIERPFAFQQWPTFEPGTWASVTAPRPPRGCAPAYAADRDEGAVAMGREHAAAAGVGEHLTFEHAALAAQHWPDGPALVVTNPPYGQRLGDSGNLRDLYAALGRRVADGGHRLCLLTADDRLARATGLELEERFTCTNGGIAVRCLVSADGDHGAAPTEPAGDPG